MPVSPFTAWKVPGKSGRENATVTDISHGGARLSNITLSKDLSFYENLRMRFRIDSPPLSDMMADSVIVWMRTDSDAGVRFLNLPREYHGAITDIARASAWMIHP